MSDELVLVVDDDEDLREMIALVLLANGFRVVGAADGVEAIGKLREGVMPSVILLDLRMPRMNGLEFLEALQATPACAVPVIAVTGDVGACRAAIAAGARVCLRKPVNAESVVGSVHQNLH